MFKNYLKVAFRNLWKNKGFSFINIVGLAIGMASAVLILLWMQNETSYDDFHEKKDRIYEMWNRAEFSGEVHSWNTTPAAGGGHAAGFPGSGAYRSGRLGGAAFV